MVTNELIPIEVISSKIFLIRKQRVLLDRDLADIYGVSTKRLNEQVKRNIDRFPPDFMFQLAKIEKDELVAKCDRLSSMKHSSTMPFVFNEHGALMLSSILKTETAVKISILIIRAFTKLKQIIQTNEEVRKKVADLENRQNKTDEDVQMLISAVNMLLDPPTEEQSKKFGFV